MGPKDGAVSVQGIENVLIREQQRGFVFVDKIIDFLRVLLFSQQGKIEHHDTGIDIAGFFGKMEAVTVKVLKKGAFDCGRKRQTDDLKVDGIKTAQIVEDNKVRDPDRGCGPVPAADTVQQRV